MTLSSKTLSENLKSIFGFNKFRANQEEIIQNLLDGNNSMVIMPTGGGKSMCYQLPALLSDGCAIVVSPLIALMKNQVDVIRGYYKTKVLHMYSILRYQVTSITNQEDIKLNKTKLLYVAPESLLKKTVNF